MKAINRQRALLILLFLCCFWAYLHPIIGISQKGSISIHFKHINTKQETIALSLYDVSDMIEKKSNSVTYTKAMLEELEQEVKRKNLAAFTHTSDENNNVEWQELSKGSYLIVQPKAADFGIMEPLLISLPAQTADKEESMNVVIEPAVIHTTIVQADTAVNHSMLYIPAQTISLQDVFLLFCMFSGTILILSLWKYQREQREF